MPTPEPLLHDTVKQRLSSIVSRPPHALLLAGPAGSGKGTVARWLAATLLGISSDKLDSYPHYLQLAPEGNKAIGIDAVRELEHVISLKIPGAQTVNRVIVILDAHLLTTEAQNSLLKTLEEPPAGTVLLLTSSQQSALLPTIQSRLQVVELLAPLRADLEAALRNKGVEPAEMARILALSGGLPGLAFALADNDESHPLIAAAKTARELLQQPAFEKLCKVEALSKDKEAARQVIQILMQMSHAALLTGRGAERWQRVLASAYQADEALSRGAQPKLALTNLMLSL